jgi:hypothetical protein
LYNCNYHVYAVIHKQSDDYIPVNWVLIPNIGLEWGAYDYYLKHIWNKESDVLFCHDDIKVESPEVFDEISKLKDDCVFIFKDEPDEIANKGRERIGIHGRAVFMKRKFVQEFLDNGGFWYDQYNRGVTEDTDITDVNRGIKMFYKDALILAGDGYTINSAHIKGWTNGHRGNI